MKKLYEKIKNTAQKTHRKPVMMIAMWVPADGQIILGSSIVAGPDNSEPNLFSAIQSGFAYNEHPSHIPAGARNLLKAAETSGGGWANCHRTKGR